MKSNSSIAKVVVAVLAMGITTLTIADCTRSGDLVGSSDLPGTIVPVEFVNDGSNEEPIHILGPQEGFDPSNRIEPGGSRTTSVRLGLGERRDEVEFRAGQNEVVFDVIVCQHSFLGSLGTARVRWREGSGLGLSCEGALTPVASGTSLGAPR